MSSPSGNIECYPHNRDLSIPYLVQKRRHPTPNLKLPPVTATILLSSRFEDRLLRFLSLET